MPARAPFVSIDRTTRFEAAFERPDRCRDLLRLASGPGIVPRGAGLSYVAAAAGSQSVAIDMSRFNRLLAFDPQRQVLEAEAGATLGKLFDVLAPRGFYLPVQPGHPQLSLGGLIAANAHGKNQFREGVFADTVEAVTLIHPEHGPIELSRQSHPDLFDLTLGGYGLTGVIAKARIRVAPLPGRRVNMHTFRVGSFEETLAFLDRRNAEFDLLQSWHDLSRPGRTEGAGFVMAGSWDEQAAESMGATPPWPRLDPAADRRRPRIFRPLTMPWINRAYTLAEARKAGPRSKTVFDYLFPVARKPFYFDWYGERGLIEHQVLIPAPAAPDYLRGLRAILDRRDLAVPRASIKLFRGERRLLHYNGTGYSLSMDFFNDEASRAALAEIDGLDLAHGIIANIIKDSRLSAETVRAQYPQYQEFRDRLAAFDPARRVRSALSERLGL